MSMNENNTNELNMIVFNDQIGRITIGELVNQDGDVLTVRNPAIVQVTKNENGNPAVGLLPTFYSALMEDPQSDVDWVYNVKNINISNVKLNERAKKLYLATFNKIDIGNETANQTNESGDEGKVVNLFDKEEE